MIVKITNGFPVEEIRSSVCDFNIALSYRFLQE